MLKITYTENGLHLERIGVSLETWLSNRVLVCLRAGTSIYAEPGTASLLLPLDLPYFRDSKLSQEQEGSLVTIDICDESSAEAIFKGTWVATEGDCENGIFVCSLEEELEFFLHRLWQEKNLDASLID